MACAEVTQSACVTIAGSARRQNRQNPFEPVPKVNPDPPVRSWLTAVDSPAADAAPGLIHAATVKPLEVSTNRPAGLEVLACCAPLKCRPHTPRLPAATGPNGSASTQAAPASVR